MQGGGAGRKMWIGWERKRLVVRRRKRRGKKVEGAVGERDEGVEGKWIHEGEGGGAISKGK